MESENNSELSSWSVFATRTLATISVLAVVRVYANDLVKFLKEALFDNSIHASLGSSLTLLAYGAGLLSITWLISFIVLVLLQNRFSVSFPRVFPTLNRLFPGFSKLGRSFMSAPVIFAQVIVGCGTGGLLFWWLSRDLLSLLRADEGEIIDQFGKLCSTIFTWGAASLFAIAVVVAVLTQIVWYIRLQGSENGDWR